MRCRERVWREVPARLGGARRPEADGRGWGAVGRSDAPRRACVCGAAGAGTQGHVVTCLHCFSREDCLHSLPSYVRCEMLGVTPGSGSCWPQRAPPRGFCSLVPSPPQPRPAAPRFDGRPQPLPVSPPHLLWRTCCRVSWLHNPTPPPAFCTNKAAVWKGSDLHPSHGSASTPPSGWTCKYQRPGLGGHLRL